MNAINIGFGNIVMSNRIVAIVSPESSPIRRLINDAKNSGELVDATYGRKTRSVVIMDSNQLILSSVQVDTISNRLAK